MGYYHVISNMAALLSLLFLLVMRFLKTQCTELTFELPDNARQCFYEEMKQNIKAIIDFQVIYGGNFDVDLTINGPNNKEIYSVHKRKYDTYEFTTYIDGEYEFCFSNEFSSFTHKRIYFELASSDEPPLTEEIGAHHVALTQLETSAVKIHEGLRVVHDYQTHHRLRESQGKADADYLNHEVQFWSLWEGIVFIVIGFSQVFILRRFFAEKRNTI